MDFFTIRVISLSLTYNVFLLPLSETRSNVSAFTLFSTMPPSAEILPSYFSYIYKYMPKQLTYIFTCVKLKNKNSQ